MSRLPRPPISPVVPLEDRTEVRRMFEDHSEGGVAFPSSDCGEGCEMVTARDFSSRGKRPAIGRRVFKHN